MWKRRAAPGLFPQRAHSGRDADARKHQTGAGASRATEVDDTVAEKGKDTGRAGRDRYAAPAAAARHSRNMRAPAAVPFSRETPISSAACLIEEADPTTSRFLHKVFHGAIEQVVVSMLNTSDPSPDELKQLAKIIADARRRKQRGQRQDKER